VTSSDPLLLHRRRLQRPRIKVKVHNENMVAPCMLYCDAYHTRPDTQNAGASGQLAVVVRPSQLGNHPRSVVQNVQAVIGTP
jgi:hypothetical protein